MRIIAPALFLFLLAACGETSSADPAPIPPDPKLAQNASYVTPAKYKTECFGRHLIDVPSEMEWAMASSKRPYYASASFTDKVFSGEDVQFYGRVEVSATATTEPATYELAKSETKADGNVYVHGLKTGIETNKRRIEESKSALLDEAEIQRARRDGLFDKRHPMPGASESEIAEAVKNEIKQSIKDIEADIKENEQTIAEFGEHKLNLPDSYAYKRSDSLVAYLWRDKRVYRFATRKSEGESFEAMAAKFSETLQRFRTRTLYEIPAEPGVCIPYGFFADNGSVWYQLTNSLRLKDAPNVMYTVGIGKNGGSPKATGLNVWAASIMQGAGSYVERQITQRIKPREIKIGAMHGIMGGFTIKPDAEKGNDQEQSYHLQAGYDGEANSDFFPFVTFQMRSFTKNADPSLSRVAPPLKQSEIRLLGIMKSLRLNMQQKIAMSSEGGLP